jgi:hypothetical protein
MNIMFKWLSRPLKQTRQFNKEVVIPAQTAYGMASDREDAI